MTSSRYNKWRVNGVLEVSRSIGDYPLKNIVIAEPDISQFSIQPSDSYVLLATDGLWDVMSLEDCANFIDSYLQEKYGDKSSVCESLCSEALRRKADDNVSIVIVFFEHEATSTAD